MAAHDSNKNSIRHDLRLSLGPRNIDLEAELTFFSARSFEERVRIDADNDGTLQKREVSAYLAALAAEVRDRVRILVDGKPLETYPLFDPELDLLGQQERVQHSHVLRLTFFARTPPWLRSGSRLEVENALWSDGIGLHDLDAIGSGDFELAPDPMESAFSPGDGTAFLSSARCLAVGKLDPVPAPAAEDLARDWWNWRRGILVLWGALTLVLALWFLRDRRITP